MVCDPPGERQDDFRGVPLPLNPADPLPANVAEIWASPAALLSGAYQLRHAQPRWHRHFYSSSAARARSSGQFAVYF